MGEGPAESAVGCSPGSSPPSSASLKRGSGVLMRVCGARRVCGVLISSPNTMLFAFPPIYSFPPFFTRQVNADAWDLQLRQWQELVLQYTRHHRIYVLSPTGAPLQAAVEDEDVEAPVPPALPLFTNSEIGRLLRQEVVLDIWAAMVQNGTAEYLDGKQPQHGTGSVIVYWKKPQEWAQLIVEWVETTGQQGLILTLFELRSLDAVRGQPWFRIHPVVLHKALAVLVKQGRAQMLTEDGEVTGVKIV